MRRTDFDVEAGKRLREIREEAGLRQRDIGRWIGSHQTVVSNIESGERRLALSEAVIIAHNLDLDLTDLVP